LTGYPTLDATGNNTYGVAVGVQNLFDFDRQLVVEGAVLKTMGPAAGRAAPGDQYGLGLRYQQPISNSIIVRFDTMVAIREHVRNLFGARIELRTKY